MLSKKKDKLKSSSNEKKTKKIIYKTLKKRYMNYKSNVWKKIFTEKDWEKYIDENWLDDNGSRNHGGYISPEEMKTLLGDNSVLPKEFPKLEVKVNKYTIIIPTCAYNSALYQKKYISTLRKYLYEFNSDILELDLSKNGGGKTEVIASGLLPLFLLQNNKILTKLELGNDKKKKGLIIKNGEINNLPVKVSKAKKILIKPKKIIIKMSGQTASAGEQTLLALTVLKGVTKTIFEGKPTAGFTTWIEYIDLPNGGGIEFPVGVMTSSKGVKCRKNKKLYPEDLNA